MVKDDQPVSGWLEPLRLGLPPPPPPFYATASTAAAVSAAAAHLQPAQLLRCSKQALARALGMWGCSCGDLDLGGCGGRQAGPAHPVQGHRGMVLAGGGEGAEGSQWVVSGEGGGGGTIISLKPCRTLNPHFEAP